MPTFKEQMEILGTVENPKVLVNTFEELERDALRSIDVDRLRLVPIGPLIPSDKSYGGDLFKQGDIDYIRWLSSQERRSVVYVSFGSISVLSAAQMEELGRGLVQAQRPFLWAVREEGDRGKLRRCVEGLKERGLMVGWCSQVEVLSHPSVGCFVTHCGWNSTMEGITCGVPLVAFPQWTDQTTNAKMMEDVWKVGVRVRVSDEEEEGRMVKSEEIKRCLELVMGSEEIRESVKRWRDLAVGAVKEGGSSHANLNAFIHQVSQECLLS